jgi:hypothetical protein
VLGGDRSLAMSIAFGKCLALAVDLHLKNLVQKVVQTNPSPSMLMSITIIGAGL